MTLANRITLGRIFLIPLFVGFAVCYGEGVRTGVPVDGLRWAAFATFVVASVSDALDGWIARRFAQRTRLGAILDPLADKGLLLAAILTLSLAPWPVRLPAWFAVLVVARDVLVVCGCLFIHRFLGELTIRPTRLGKVTTFTQMLAIGWVMLQWPVHNVPVALAALFTVVSGVGYGVEATRLLQLGGHGNPSRH